MPSFDKIVIVTKKTPLEELIYRFNTTSQAKFYIETMGGNFSEYENVSIIYEKSLNKLKSALPSNIKKQFIDRDFLPNFLFGEKDIVICLGPDGLVVNTAKYLNKQPILAVNPDINRIDGILIPFDINEIPKIIGKILANNFNTKSIRMAKAELNDGQSLYGFNDLFIGYRSHASARYILKYKGKVEHHLSSGIIVSTGAGSTGWFKSIINSSVRISKEFYREKSFKNIIDTKFDWTSDYLYFSVREPFPSKASQINLIFGKITKNNHLTLISKMPENGVIFSDGIESDFINFNSGSIATIKIADKKAVLIIKDDML